MRSAFLILSLMLVMGMACSSGSSPTAPGPQIADLPTWEVSVDGQTYMLGVGDLLSNRVLAAVVPGTNMTPNELRVYFAVSIVKRNMPVWFQCPVYQIFYPIVAAESDATILGWVTLVESGGYDIPNGPPPAPIC